MRLFMTWGWIICLCMIARADDIPEMPEFDPDGMTAYEVIRIVDGDTIKVEIEGDVYSVRLVGVDTPETKHPNKPVEYFGKEFLSLWIWAREVPLYESIFAIGVLPCCLGVLSGYKLPDR